MNIDFDRLNCKNTMRYMYIYLAILFLTSVVQSARKGAILSFKILPEESLEVGGKLRRTCEASEPGWNISWQVPFYKNNSPQIPHDYLAYDNIQPDMNGVYTCFAKKEGRLLQKSFNLDVEKGEAVVSEIRKEDNKLSRCGQRPAFESSPYRIFGGRNAKPGEIPWQVFLVNAPIVPEKGPWPQFFCGGSIIHERWILTAAHCFMKDNDTFKNFDDLHVVIGSLKSQHSETNTSFHNNYDNFGKSVENVQAIKVENITSHEKFVGEGDEMLRNDIALLRLKQPIRFGDFSQVICLGQPEENFVGKVCQSSGWGLEETGRPSKRLKVVKLPIIPMKVCKQTYREINLSEFVFHTNLCTLYPKGGKGTCSGDSGGPLFCRRNNGQFVQSGITSWHVKCGGKKSPSVYTQVSEYVDWIREKTGLDFA